MWVERGVRERVNGEEKTVEEKKGLSRKGENGKVEKEGCNGAGMRRKKMRKEVGLGRKGREKGKLGKEGDNTAGTSSEKK